MSNGSLCQTGYVAINGTKPPLGEILLVTYGKPDTSTMTTVSPKLEDLALPQDIVEKILHVNRAVDPPLILIFDLPKLSAFFDLARSHTTTTSPPPMTLHGVTNVPDFQTALVQAFCDGTLAVNFGNCFLQCSGNDAVQIAVRMGEINGDPFFNCVDPFHASKPFLTVYSQEADGALTKIRFSQIPTPRPFA